LISVVLCWGTTRSIAGPSWMVSVDSCTSTGTTLGTCTGRERPSNTDLVPHEVFRYVEFPFADGRFPDHLGAVVQRTVVTGQEPAREVVHTEDNSWQVADGVNDPNLPGAVIVEGMAHVAAEDPSVAELASLPLGHIAQRAEKDQPWIIGVHEWPTD
jgi:hypothetical protein